MVVNTKPRTGYKALEEEIQKNQSVVQTVFMPEQSNTSDYCVFNDSINSPIHQTIYEERLFLQQSNIRAITSIQPYTMGITIDECLYCQHSKYDGYDYIDLDVK